MQSEVDPNIYTFIEKGIGKSIVKEVLGIESVSPTSDLQQALRQLNLVDAEAELLKYEDLTPWARGGAETYIATGRTKYHLFDQVIERTFLAKAIVTFPTNPEVTADHWCKKLDLLMKIGVNCPVLYSNFKATLYQEFLPSRLSDLWETAGEVDRFNFTCDLTKIFAALDAAGFRPISYYFHDLMVRNSNTVCIVDVGEDIGEWDFDDPHNQGFEAFTKSPFFLASENVQLKDLYEDHFWRVRGIIADLPN